MTCFNIFLIIMSAIAAIVFVALYFVDAGYGMFFNKKWGPSVPSRWGWMMMEAPVFIAMLLLWAFSGRQHDEVRLAFLLLFLLHYLQRSFIFPLLIKGNNRMPLVIVLMAIVFNMGNAAMQGGWLFYVSPSELYPTSWFGSWQFIVGVILFFTGMYINIDSDRIIRNLRKPGDSAHYLPRGGMYKHVSSANYFGELVEWTGFAILTWSLSGAVFVWWTFANLAPRAARIYNRYEAEFGAEFTNEKRKRILPFIY